MIVVSRYKKNGTVFTIIIKDLPSLFFKKEKCFKCLVRHNVTISKQCNLISVFVIRMDKILLLWVKVLRPPFSVAYSAFNIESSNIC